MGMPSCGVAWGTELRVSWSAGRTGINREMGYRGAGKMGMLSYGGAWETGLRVSRSAGEPRCARCWGTRSRELPGSWDAAGARSWGAGAPG